jgi:hypothetical protein
MYDVTFEQRTRICRALLSRIGYGHLWNSHGPTAEAKKIVDQYGGPMSNPQWVIYQVVWFVWGRPADVKLQEIMLLPEPLSEWIVRLMESLLKGSRAVESWLASFERMTGIPRERTPRIHHLS